MPRIVQRFDDEPRFWQFLGGLRHDDVLIELIQNDLDANALHTTITFLPDRLVCTGDGERVDENGWQRLSFILGAGDRVEAKHSRIGVKNHGLKACFTIGDTITVRSDGRKTIQMLYKDGHSKPPSPGAWDAPEWDENAPQSGCSVEVPYRKKKLRVSKGEPVELDPVVDDLIERLFHGACNQLPTRLMGVVRPRVRSLRDRYTLTLNHHRLGSIELYWEAKRGRARGKGKRDFMLFSRECRITSNVEGIPSQIIREQACTFKITVPSVDKREIPAFFIPEKQSFVGEVAWPVGKTNRPEATRGTRRYPIGYEPSSEAALSGLGVHFSGPYNSDAERHSANESEWNRRIDYACKDALVDIMAAYLLPRYGGRAMELYIGDSPSGTLDDFVNRLVHYRALPLRPSIRQQSGRQGDKSARFILGPRRIARGKTQRVVVPVFTWDSGRISPLLADICPAAEDQIDPNIPTPVLRLLSDNSRDDIITFDESDAIERLQPQLEISCFPWEDTKEWQRALGDASTANKYLDVVLEAIQQGEITSQQDVAGNAHLPDDKSIARPLAQMFSAVSLPPNLNGQPAALLLHPKIRRHALLKRPPWKPKTFTLDAYLNESQLETASWEERRRFWRWLRHNRRELTRSRALRRIADLPVWPSTDHSFVTLEELCEPSNKRVATAMGNAIRRPSPEILQSGLIKVAGRGRLAIRNIPTEKEVEHFLSSRLQRLSREQSLTSKERLEFQKLESDMALLASVRQIRKALIDLSDEHAGALANDGYLRKPSELVRNEGPTARLHLPTRYIIDRSQKKLDQLPGWEPRQFPTSDQVVETLKEDSARVDAHVWRLQAYLEQAKREGVAPNDLRGVACIPANGTLYPPSELALPGQPDYWGTWKTHLPVHDKSADEQRLYQDVGVLGRVPTPMDSLRFFQWLAEQEPATIAIHIAQILRHIGRRQSGPLAWCNEYPHVPFVPVESHANEIRLATKWEATKPRSGIAVPDFPAVEEAIRANSKYPIQLAVVATRRVEHPINSELRELGLQTLRGLAGEPTSVSASGSMNPQPQFKYILDSLRTGLKGKQLPKRLEGIDLDTHTDRLRSNWRERLSQIQEIKTADSVMSVYRVFRTQMLIPTSGEIDKESGILYLSSSSDLETSFFDSIANMMFETPKQFLGGVLRYALDLKLNEHDILSPAEVVDSPEGGHAEPSQQDSETGDVIAARGRHSLTNNPAQNQPNPGPIPFGAAQRSSEGKAGRASSRRPASPREVEQINDLKENQYAWHCQACLAKWAPKVLIPPQSYAEHPQNRRGIMEAHHCDQVSAGGADHLGNILLLCHYHHLDIGDAISRAAIAKSLPEAKSSTRHFPAANGTTVPIRGKVITVRPPQRKAAVRLFFTKEHGDYWLEKAREAGLA